MNARRFSLLCAVGLAALLLRPALHAAKKDASVDISLTSLEGKKVRLSDLRGKPWS